VTDKQEYWHFEEIEWRHPPTCLFKNSDIGHAFCFRASVYINFFWKRISTSVDVGYVRGERGSAAD